MYNYYDDHKKIYFYNLKEYLPIVYVYNKSFSFCSDNNTLYYNVIIIIIIYL